MGISIFVSYSDKHGRYFNFLLTSSKRVNYCSVGISMLSIYLIFNPKKQLCPQYGKEWSMVVEQVGGRKPV